MNFWQRFKRLSFWNKLGAVAGICTIAGLLLFRSRDNSVRVSVNDSPGAKVQNAVNSPNASQIFIEDLTINLSQQLERKLIINTVYVNKLQGDKYVTLLRGKLKAPYPVPNLRVEAHGETVDEIKFAGTRIYVLSDRGKREGYVFATWQDAIGTVELKILTRQPGKLHISFTIQE